MCLYQEHYTTQYKSGLFLLLDIGHWLSSVVHTEVRFGQAAKLAASFPAKSKHTKMFYFKLLEIQVQMNLSFGHTHICFPSSLFLIILHCEIFHIKGANWKLQASSWLLKLAFESHKDAKGKAQRFLYEDLLAALLLQRPTGHWQ